MMRRIRERYPFHFPSRSRHLLVEASVRLFPPGLFTMPMILHLIECALLSSSYLSSILHLSTLSVYYYYVVLLNFVVNCRRIYQRSSVEQCML